MKRIAKKLLLVLTLVAVSLKLVSFTETHLSAGNLSTRAIPAIPGGQTRFELGPLGVLSWPTHWGLLNLEARFVVAGDAKNLPSLEELTGSFTHLLWAKLPWLALWGLLLGLLLFEGARRRQLILGSVISTIATTGLALVVVGANILTFNPKIEKLTSSGPLDAPRMTRLIKDVLERWNDGKIVLDNISAGAERLHGQFVNGSNGEIPEETTDLLLISDLHNNPLGVLIAKDLGNQFEIDGVLNAGDFTDLGTAPEAEILKQLGDFRVPQLIVAGNHEDLEALRVMREVPGVTILDGEIAEIAGLTVLGASDPAAGGIENSAEAEAYAAICEILLEKTIAESPDVLLVHNPEVGKCVAEYAEENGIPLIFAWGHTHEALAERRGSVMNISAGTSGAGGLKAEPPYGFGLLSFDSVTKEFISACYFLYGGLGDLRSTSCAL